MFCFSLVGLKSKDKLYSFEIVDIICVGNVYSSFNLSKMDFIFCFNCENVIIRCRVWVISCKNGL